MRFAAAPFVLLFACSAANGVGVGVGAGVALASAFNPPAIDVAIRRHSPRSATALHQSYLDDIGSPGRTTETTTGGAGGGSGGPASYLDDIAGPGRRQSPGGGSGQAGYLDSFGGPAAPAAPDAYAAPAPSAPAASYGEVPAPASEGRGSYLDDIAGPGRSVSAAADSLIGPSSYLYALAGPGRRVEGGSGPAGYLDTMNAPTPLVEYPSDFFDAYSSSAEQEREVVQVVQDGERGNRWYRGIISSVRSINVYSVSYPDGDEDINLPEDAIRPQDGVSPLGVGTPVEVLSWEDRFGPFAEEQ